MCTKLRSSVHVALSIALIAVLVSSASATELKVRGNLDVYGMWSANLNDHDSDYRDGDNYTTTQRMRAYFDYVANENLKAVLGLEIDTVWGDGDADWGTDVDGYAIEIKHAYLNFTFPDSTVNVQAGLQYVALPSVFGNPVFDDDAPAITVSAQVNPMFGVTVGYTRDTDGSDSFSDDILWDGMDRDDIDMAFIAAPVALNGFTISPYFAYAWLGANALGAVDDATVWVLGANAALNVFDPLTFAADLIYGNADFGDADYETKGWYAALAATYKMDFMSATLFTTYATGADEDSDKDNFLPTLAEGWGLTPYIGGVRAFSTSYDSFGTNALGVGSDGTGLWTIGLVLDNISFVEKLSHKLVIAYGQGTSDEDAAYYDARTGGRLAFTEEDDCWELYMVNKYMIYENLAAINEFGYFQANSQFYKDGTGEDLDASYFATVGFSYKF
jgi:hypothetical protein